MVRAAGRHPARERTVVRAEGVGVGAGIRQRTFQKGLLVVVGMTAVLAAMAVLVMAVLCGLGLAVGPVVAVVVVGCHQ